MVMLHVLLDSKMDLLLKPMFYILQGRLVDPVMVPECNGKSA